MAYALVHWTSIGEYRDLTLYIESTPAVDSTSVDHTTTTDTAKDHSITKAVSEGQPTRPTIGDSNAESTAASASTSKHQGHAASCKPGEKCEDCE